MPRASTNDLLAFITAARERSFTRAAAKLGTTPSNAGLIVPSLPEMPGTSASRM
jgi:hypothetical protein